MAAGTTNARPDMLDVAIIGGGVSGIYSGWRLCHAPAQELGALRSTQQAAAQATTQNGDRLRVAVFEMSDRIGGRLLSLTPPEIPVFKAELGGMRYLTTQPLISNLVTKLDIATHPFAMGGPENVYYLRGHHLRRADFSDPAKVPYRLSFQEQGKTPGQIITDAIEMIVPGATRLTPAQWQAVKQHFKFNGAPLYEQGFWNVLYQVVSNEAFELLLDAGGYNTTLCNWNAAEALPWYLGDFGPTAQYRGFDNGFEQVPLALAQQFHDAGGTLHFEHTLAEFARITDGPHAGAIRLRFTNGNTVHARHVILAMPRRALELLGAGNPLLADPGVRALLCSVTPHPLFKLFLCYRYPWWKSAGVQAGCSVTDMPLRQVYYFGAEPEGPATYNEELRDSLVMGSYDDGPFVGFWTGLADCEERPLRGMPNGQRWDYFCATPGMIAQVQRQLKLVHQLEYIPEPYAAAFVDWSIDPFGGGWHSWNIHVKAWEVQAAVRKPRPDWNVYICGEAYSGHQGWVEGALETAEAILQMEFGLASPVWTETERA